MDTDIDMDKDMDTQTDMERDKNRDKTWRHGHIDRHVRDKTRRALPTTVTLDIGLTWDNTWRTRPSLPYAREGQGQRPPVHLVHQPDTGIVPARASPQVEPDHDVVGPVHPLLLQPPHQLHQLPLPRCHHLRHQH